MRAPLAPIGWPRAIAPPFTLTFASSTPSMRIELSATEANASLISNRSMSSTDRPAFSSAFLVAFAGRAREVGEVVGHRGLGDDRRQHLAAVRLRPLVASEHERAGAVVHARRVAGGVRAVLDERSAQLRRAPRARCSRRGASSISTVVSPFFD